MQRFFALWRQYRWPVLALAVIILFSFFRVWRLNLPTGTVFDEVYFPTMAWQYLQGESFFDIHPPLGKLIIALCEKIFGNTPLGWRMAPLLAGLATLPAAYWTGKQIFGNKTVGLLTAFLVAIDGLFIVYSRTGLMDSFLILFGILSVGFVWQFRRRRLAGGAAWGSLLAAGLFAGLALAVKWIGFGFWPPVFLLALYTVYNHPVKGNLASANRRSDWLVLAVSFILLPFLLYTLPFLANWQDNFWQEFATWHRQSWEYNINLDASHPYASKWWSWPFLLRPIWFYYQNDSAGNILGVNAIGNPIIWWASTVAVVYTTLALGYTLWQKLSGGKKVLFVKEEAKDEVVNQAVVNQADVLPLIFMLGHFLAFYLPWVLVGRVLFLYHYFGAYLFALILLAYWLSQSMRGKLSKFAVALLLILAVTAGLAFMPIWTAYPIGRQWFDGLMWFKSWI